MDYEVNRLSTFNHWPVDFINKDIAARIGYFYTMQSDIIKCQFCGIETFNFDRYDSLLEEHFQYSPICPLINREPTANHPICSIALDATLPAIQYLERYRRLNGDYLALAGFSMQSANAARIAQERREATKKNIPRKDPENFLTSAAHNDLKTTEQRLRTYKYWPIELHHKPEQLSEAGLFYTNLGDCIRCFHCDIILDKITKETDIWELHVERSPRCKFIEITKGKTFIRETLEKLEAPSPKKKQRKSWKKIFKKSEEPSTSAEAEEEEDSNSAANKNLCRICYERDYCIMFLNCQHVFACGLCALKMDKCGLCRQPIKDMKRCYLA
jgi:hypothetical protein